MRRIPLRPAVLAAALVALGTAPPGAFAPVARAEQIVVSNYAVSANGMPYAVALEKGFFKEEGADVTGILSSSGGGTTVRNLLGGNLAYGEIDLAGTVTAIQQGADLKIISDNVLTVAEFAWATKPDSAIRTLHDLKGHKLAYTNPRSTSQALEVLLLEAAGEKPDAAELVKTGGFGEGLVALDLGAVDSAPLTEPLWSKNAGKYRIVFEASQVLPPLCNVIGVATGSAVATRGDFLRAVLRARRKAVAFTYAHPEEAAAIIAKAYNLEVPVALAALRNLLGSTEKAHLPYWGLGDFHFDGMDRMIRAQKLVGALNGDVDWSKIVDTRFLPDDLKPKP